MLENAGATTFSKCYNYYCKYSLLKKVSPTTKKGQNKKPINRFGRCVIGLYSNTFYIINYSLNSVKNL